MSSPLVLRGARIRDGSVADVRIEGDAIAAVGEVVAQPGDHELDVAGYVLLPAPAEPHAHLDKALTADLIPNPKGDLLSAISAVMAHHATLTHEDVERRATAAALEALAHGATALRTHVDVGGDVGVLGVEALVKVREQLRPLLDLQLCALVASPTTGPDGAGNRAALRTALELGVDVGGGCPHIDPDPHGCLEVCLAAAADFGRPLDLHTDETLDEAVLGLRDYARLVQETGFPWGATASHCVSLGVQHPDVAGAVAKEVAAAGIGVVALPQTNLFLQGRDSVSAPPRGLTALRVLLDAGVTVAGGADNVRDPFNSMGRNDPLETAALLVMAGHLTPGEAYDAVSSGARAVLGLPRVVVAPGSPAELLAIRATSLGDAIASASQDRIVIHAGRIVARTTVERHYYPTP